MGSAVSTAENQIFFRSGEIAFFALQNKGSYVFLKSPMNKAQLIETIQKQMGPETTKKAAEEALNAVVEAIKEGVQKDEKVQIIGFGTFVLKTRSARTGRNPKTGEPLEIAESRTVGFKASSSLKD